MLETLRGPHVNKQEQGKLLVFVWALEQKHSRRGWQSGDKQDVMVPWVMPQHSRNKPAREVNDTALASPQAKTFQRYYHLYAAGELEQDIHTAGGVVLNGGYEKDNWWVIATRAPP